MVARNRQAQGAVATFVGAFLYAVVGYSAGGTGYYGQGGRAILFFTTLAMLILVAITLLRWLDQLLRLARVDHVITAVEAETAASLEGVFGGWPSNEGPDCLSSETMSVSALRSVTCRMSIFRHCRTPSWRWRAASSTPGYPAA